MRTDNEHLGRGTEREASPDTKQIEVVHTAPVAAHNYSPQLKRLYTEDTICETCDYELKDPIAEFGLMQVGMTQKTLERYSLILMLKPHYPLTDILPPCTQSYFNQDRMRAEKQLPLLADGAVLSEYYEDDSLSHTHLMTDLYVPFDEGTLWLIADDEDEGVYSIDEDTLFQMIRDVLSDYSGS